MSAARRLILVGLAVLGCGAAGPSFGADRTIAAAPTGERTQAGIVVRGISGSVSVMAASALRELPAVRMTVSFETVPGPRQLSVAGPLLWTVLVHAGAVDTTKPRDQVRQVASIAGSDGYTAVIALGEIAPAFEHKQVIVADQANGRPLAPGHFRIVVPGDRYGGRSVQDVIRITVTVPEPARP